MESNETHPAKRTFSTTCRRHHDLFDSVSVLVRREWAFSTLYAGALLGLSTVHDDGSPDVDDNERLPRSRIA